MEKDVNKVLSDNLTKLRKNKKLTQLELAEKFNFSDKTISKWESGESLPNIETLYKLSTFYGIKLDDLMDENLDLSEKKQQIDNSWRNKLIISLLAVSLVWIIATIVYVYTNIIFQRNLWIAFVWAVPISFIVAIVFNSIWGKRMHTFIYVSLLIWTFIAAFYFQTLAYNLWVIFIIAIPAQISIILCSKIKSYK